MQNFTVSDSMKKIEKYICVVPYAVIVLFFICYSSFLKSIDVWTDEAYMMQMLRETNTLKDAFLYAASDTHPPAYFVALKVVTMVFGQNLIAAKMLSVLSLIGTMILGVIFLNHHKKIKASILYVFLVGAIPCSMAFSVEIRMYGFAMFFLTGCGISAFELLLSENKKYMIGCILFGAGASYSHYFSLAATALIYGFLLIGIIGTNRKVLKYWFGAVLASIILYAPWLPYFYVQFSRVSTAFWIPEITWKTLLEYTGWYFDTDTPYTAIMMGSIMITMLFMLGKKCIVEKNREAYFSVSCFGVWILTIIVGIGVSAAIRPVFLIKYSYPMVGLLCLAMAISLEKLKERIYIVLICFLLCLGIVDYQNTYVDEYKSTMTEATMDYLNANMKEKDVIVYNYEAFGFIYGFYFKSDKMVKLSEMDFARKDIGDIYFLHTTWNPMPDQATVEAFGWKQEYIGMYGIEHNEFKIYRYFR